MMPSATNWMARYSTVAAPSASRIASGTVRAGFFTSPLGTVAPSMPENAKIMMPAVLSTVLALGTSVHARFEGSMKNTPTAMNTSSGTSFTTVIVSSRRAPVRTPRILRDTSTATTTTIAALVTQGSCPPLVSARMERTTAVITAAAANQPVVKTRQPATKPAIGPSAVSTYAYAPPVEDTRLPDSAKHSTTRPMTIAHATYASGAALPRPITANAGSEKMPLPTV
jgi:hypothetical protein